MPYAYLLGQLADHDDSKTTITTTSTDKIHVLPPIHPSWLIIMLLRLGELRGVEHRHGSGCFQNYLQRLGLYVSLLSSTQVCQLFSAAPVICLAWETIDRTFCSFIPAILSSPLICAAATLAMLS